MTAEAFFVLVVTVTNLLTGLQTSSHTNEPTETMAACLNAKRNSDSKPSVAMKYAEGGVVYVHTITIRQAECLSLREESATTQ